MKQNFSIVYKFLLILGDTAALIGAFLIAYILRVSIDSRPVANPTRAATYLTLIITLLPLVIAMFSLLGLYSRRVFERRPKEASRLFVGAVASMVLLITFDFFQTIPYFQPSSSQFIVLVLVLFYFGQCGQFYVVYASFYTDEVLVLFGWCLQVTPTQPTFLPNI